MALHKVNTANHPEEERRQQDAPAVQSCPMCAGRMELVYQRHGQQVIVCADCHTGVTVPATAWNIARIKRDATWVPKP